MKLGLGIGLNRARRGGAAKGPVNTVAPAITGTTERGELLTCSTGTWTGTGTITYAYQWRRNGTPIAGATSNTYTLVAADDNATITCIVTATDNEGSRAASSNAVGPVLGAPFSLTAPVLSGTETVGQTLSVTDGTWQGVATITFAYQWRRDGSNISGATSSTYTLVAADYDAVIDCVVTATNSLDSASADSNDTGAIAGLAPTNDVAPSISGDDGLGDVLTRTAGTWSGVPTPSIAGQWRRNGVAIPGETGTTYTIVAADSGAAIDYLETATNAEGSASADSNDITAQTFAAPTNDVAPSISGNTGLGDTLTRTAGTWTGTPTPAVTGQWQRNGTPIAGETGTTYTIAVADSGADIDYLETATNAIGSASADSNDITAQTFVSPTIGGIPTIAGTEEVGETLTATAAAATGNPAPTTSWQWQRSADGSTGWADISGATSSTYVLDAADENNYVRVKQIETNALGSDEAVSAATGQITAPSNIDFRILVNTTNSGVSNSDQFNFTGALGDYDVEVYDQTGTTLLETITGLSDAATITIAAGAGTYELRVFPAATNGFNRIQFNNGGDRLKLLEIRNWGEVVWSTMERAFFGCSNMTSVTSSVNPDLANVTNMSFIFMDCTSLTALDVSGFSTANVTNMSAMFNNCTSLTALDVSGFSTANVTNMSFMFIGCTSLTALDVSGFSTANVTNMSFMFRGCTSLTALDVSGFSTANVISMSSMFIGCNSLTSLDVSGFSTANVTNMSAMFIGCTSLTALDVSGFSTANVTNMSSMFRDCSNLTDIIGIENFSISSVTNFSNFLLNVTLPTSRYDALLINYEAQAPNPNLSFHGGNSKYTAGGAAEAARTNLATTYNWTITDGGPA
jgi:surface protein